MFSLPKTPQSQAPPQRILCRVGNQGSLSGLVSIVEATMIPSS